VPYQPFACADGHVMLAIGNDTQFAAFCRAAGCEGLAQDERFRNNALRVQNREALIGLLHERMSLKTVDQWCQTAIESGFPCGPINTIDRVFADPQVQARSMRVSVPSQGYGEVDLVASPMRFSGTPITYEAGPPSLGQDTEAVLGELGLDAAAIAALKKAKAI